MTFPVILGPFEQQAGHIVVNDDESGELWLYPIQVLPNPPDTLRGMDMFDGDNLKPEYRPILDKLGLTLPNVIADLNHPMLNELMIAYGPQQLKVKDLTPEELDLWTNHEEPSVLIRDLPDTFNGWAIFDQCEN
jgi:hypothetical protein